MGTDETLGVIAPDGSPVELYRLLRPSDEPELIHDALPRGVEILELGCGTGRLTHALLDLGHPVVAVDQSAEMLACVRGAEIVCADIELLNLGYRFAAVLLASQLVNTGNDEQRQAFLHTCRRHATPGGAVLIQRLPLDWTVSTGDIAERDGVQMVLRDVHEQDGLVSAAMEYRAGERQWRHAFTARNLDDTAFDRALAEADLILDRWCDDRRCWALARPRPTIVTD